MAYIVIGLLSLSVVLLLGALLVGQPAAAQADHVLADARATENTWLRATVYARPAPTQRVSN